MVAVVHDHGRVALEAIAQRHEEARRIHATLRVVREPLVAIGRLVLGDARRDRRATRRALRHLGQRREQAREHGDRIAFERDLGRVVGAEHGRIDVDVDQVGGRLVAVAAGRDLAEARADGEQAVAVAECVLGGGHCGTAQAEPGVQRMIRRERAQALQRRGHRRAEPIRNHARSRGPRPPRPSRRTVPATSRRRAVARPPRSRRRCNAPRVRPAHGSRASGRGRRRSAAGSPESRRTRDRVRRWSRRAPPRRWSGSRPRGARPARCPW